MANLETLFPIEFRERPLRFSTGDVSGLVREALAKLHQERTDEVDGLLAEMGRCAFHLRRLLEESSSRSDPAVGDLLEILVGNLHDALSAHGVVIRDLTGESWSVDQAEMVEVRGHAVNKDLDAPRVSFMENPVIVRDNRVIAKGAAIVETPQR